MEVIGISQRLDRALGGQTELTGVSQRTEGAHRGQRCQRELTEVRRSSLRSEGDHRVKGSSQRSEGGYRDLTDPDGAHKGQMELT